MNTFCSIDTGKFMNNQAYFITDNGCLFATFDNCCLTELERRNKAAEAADEYRAAEKKYAILFSVESFHLTHVGQINLAVCCC